MSRMRILIALILTLGLLLMVSCSEEEPKVTHNKWEHMDYFLDTHGIWWDTPIEKSYEIIRAEKIRLAPDGRLLRSNKSALYPPDMTINGSLMAKKFLFFNGKWGYIKLRLRFGFRVKDKIASSIETYKYLFNRFSKKHGKVFVTSDSKIQDVNENIKNLGTTSQTSKGYERFDGWKMKDGSCVILLSFMYQTDSLIEIFYAPASMCDNRVSIAWKSLNN